VGGKGNFVSSALVVCKSRRVCIQGTPYLISREFVGTPVQVFRCPFNLEWGWVLAAMF